MYPIGDLPEAYVDDKVLCASNNESEPTEHQQHVPKACAHYTSLLVTPFS